LSKDQLIKNGNLVLTIRRKAGLTRLLQQRSKPGNGGLTILCTIGTVNSEVSEKLPQG